MRLGRLRPKTVVLAAGVWTAQLARGLGISIPVTGGKGYHVDLATGPGDPRVPILMQEARSALTPLPERLRIAGTLDVAGLDDRPRAARVEAMRRAAARVLGHDGRPVVDVWTGLRPCAPDGLPVIGRPAGAPALVVPLAVIVFWPTWRVTATGSFSRPDVVLCTARLTLTPPLWFAVLVPAATLLTVMFTVPPAKSQAEPIVPLIVPPGAVLPRFVVPLQPGGTYCVVVV